MRYFMRYVFWNDQVKKSLHHVKALAAYFNFENS